MQNLDMKYPKKQTSPLMLLLDTVQSANLRKFLCVQLIIINLADTANTFERTSSSSYQCDF